MPQVPEHSFSTKRGTFTMSFSEAALVMAELEAGVDAGRLDLNDRTLIGNSAAGIASRNKGYTREQAEEMIKDPAIVEELMELATYLLRIFEVGMLERAAGTGQWADR